MAEAVAGLLMSAFVNIAKDKLGSAIGEQANLLSNFCGDLDNMKDVLETIEEHACFWGKKKEHACF
jgi:hypothetical protein